LAQRFDVHLVVVSKTPTEDDRNARYLAPFCSAVEVLPALPLPADADARPDSVPVLRHRAPAARRRVSQILAHNRVDLVHVEGFYLMQHVPEWVEAPVVLVEQNIEYELEQQRARAAHGDVMRLESMRRCAHTRAAELECWRRATRLATVTLEDRELIRAELPDADVSVVPDGADHVPALDEVAVAGRVDRPDRPLVVLLANFGYPPNVDAAEHLCRDILPAIHRGVADAHVWLVGNAPPLPVRALTGDLVSVTGYVPDAVPYLDAADVVVCPLRIGGGIKVKTIEALRRGKAIVSSQVGAQGLCEQARSALVIADDPSEFADAVAGLLRDPDRRVAVEAMAARAARRLPSWDESAAALGAIYDELLEAPALAPELLPILAGQSG
jgi:glycosyltransferase involved in cell wall biosynthesis